MKHGKRLGGALATNRWLHDRGLNVGSLSGATDAMFVPRSPNPASFATYRRSAARPSIKGWKPIGTSTSVTLPSRGSTSASLDRTEQTTNYRERASATKRGSDGRAGRTAREYEVQCTDSELPSPLDLVPRSLRTSELSRKRRLGDDDLSVESSPPSKLRKTGDSVRQVRLETKRSQLGIFFPEAAERSRQHADDRRRIYTSAQTVTGASSASRPDHTRSLAERQKTEIVLHSFKPPSGSDEDEMFAEAPSSSSSRQPILQADACGGTRAAPRSPMLPEETPDNPPLPQPGWQHSLGRHKPHELHPLQPPAIPQPIQTSGSDQLDPGAISSHPALPTSPLSTSVGHPAAHSLNDDLEDGEIDEHTAPEAPVPPSQKPAQNAPQKKRTKKKNKKEQNQQPPLPTDDSSSLSRKQKKARARQAKRDRQTACRQALDRIDAFEPTAEDEERLQRS
ncbi:hypothetical protein RHOSPDRAFT_37185 [Rhodotorula sp. JG-1b]|nr:hypothetical protein RHOSPDRAFT_37185 [Rhodotorula sp. JG-1b]